MHPAYLFILLNVPSVLFLSGATSAPTAGQLTLAPQLGSEGTLYIQIHHTKHFLIDLILFLFFVLFLQWQVNLIVLKCRLFVLGNEQTFSVELIVS